MAVMPALAVGSSGGEERGHECISISLSVEQGAVYGLLHQAFISINSSCKRTIEACIRGRLLSHRGGLRRKSGTVNDGSDWRLASVWFRDICSLTAFSVIPGDLISAYTAPRKALAVLTQEYHCPTDTKDSCSGIPLSAISSLMISRTSTTGHNTWVNKLQMYQIIATIFASLTENVDLSSEGSEAEVCRMRVIFGSQLK